ncbi:MAG TPA: branched-chain amino acid transaminase [Terracidiphilus sp.]|nr:branched-chain amino acid transaminase [Terracidiphilus sp.]
MKPGMNPDMIVYFGGRYVPLAEARVGILTHALNYGTGVFEGIRAHWDEESSELYVFRPLEHYDRWKQNCGILRIDVGLSAEELCFITAELMRRNHFKTDLYVRPLAYKSAERIGVCPDDENAFAIVALPFGEYLHSEDGLHAGVSSWRRIEDAAIPVRAKICGAYANSALASDDVRRAGFDEAILLNEAGHVTEGATCNLFMVRNGVLITPPVTENVLEGITRSTILELAHKELGLPVLERPIDRSELYIADELFLSGTAVGLAPVVRVDHRRVKDGAVGAWTRLLQTLYSEIVRGRRAEYRKWVLPVYGTLQESAMHAIHLEHTSVA